MDYKTNSKYIEARNTLEEKLKPIFDQIVSDYRFSATVRYSRPYVSYIVLADMVRAGWRCIDEKNK
jgi:hypothetical protein